MTGVSGPEWLVQKALYDKLKADSTLMALVTGIWDEPPTNQEYNYIVLGQCVMTPRNRLMRLGYNCNCTMHVYTKPAGLGFYPAKNIVSNMIRVLDHTKLTITGFTNVITKLDATNYEKDGDKRIGWVSFNSIVHNDTQITYS